MDFEPGDVVRLKSGGPAMTVEEVSESHRSGGMAVWCVWSEKVGNKQVVQRADFPPVVLEKASKPGVSSFRVIRA